MRLPLATDIKTRTGAPDKDARLKNSYVEIKGEQSVVRKRPIAQGGVSVGTGTAQGGIGFNISGTDYFIGFWGDTLTAYTGDGTTWNSGTSYLIGDHVSVEFVDYWADADNTNSQPPNSNWSDSYVPDVPSTTVYATWNPADKGAVDLTGGNLTATIPNGTEGMVRSTISKSSGKWYWEETVNTYNDQQILSFGVATSAAYLGSVVGFDLYGWAYADGNITGINPAKYHNNITSSYGNLLVNGDVIGFALDMDSGTLTFYLNGVSLGVAFTGLSGNMFASTSANTIFGGASVTTANFGASAFSYSVPSGYNSGLYT